MKKRNRSNWKLHIQVALCSLCFYCVLVAVLIPMMIKIREIGDILDYTVYNGRQIFNIVKDWKIVPIETIRVVEIGPGEEGSSCADILGSEIGDDVFKYTYLGTVDGFYNAYEVFDWSPNEE